MQDSSIVTIGSDARRRPNPFAVGAFLVLAGAIAYCAFIAGFPINHDAAVMLQVGDVLRHGGVPYRDIIEITPPIAAALHIIPLLVSELIPLATPTSFNLCVTLLLAFSCWQVWYLLGLQSFLFSLNQRLIFLTGWLTASLSLQLSLDYGQREHLFALMLLPWLLCRIARNENSPPPLYVSISLAVVASPFFLQKPFFLAVIFAIELALMVRARRLTTVLAPENGLLLCWGAAYLVYLITLPQDARHELFAFLIPFLARHYSVYKGDFFEEENVFTYQWVATICAIAIITSLRQSRRSVSHVTMFILMILFCFFAYLVQGKGWLYQQIPIRLSTAALLTFILCRQPITADAVPRSRTVLNVGRCAGGVLLILPVVYFLIVGHSHRVARTGYVNFMTDKIRQYTSPGDRVCFISSDVRFAYPSVVYADVPLGSRYDLDFMVPMLYQGVEKERGEPFPYRSPSEQPSYESLYLTRRAEDIARFRPKLIAIDTNSTAQALPTGFQMNKYLESNGWPATVMSNYCLVESVLDFQFYVLE